MQTPRINRRSARSSKEFAMSFWKGRKTNASLSRSETTSGGSANLGGPGIRIFQESVIYQTRPISTRCTISKRASVSHTLAS
jgi:hypothetical protein